MSEPQDQHQQVTFEIRVDQDLSHWPEPAYASFLTTSRSPHDLTLFFSQIRFPLLPPGSPMEPVIATPSARVVVPLPAVPQIVEALQNVLRDLQEQVGMEQLRAGR